MLHETRQRRRSAVLRSQRIPEETLTAAKILIQDGQLTISQISKRLGISVSTIYLRFPSARRQFGNPDSGPPVWVSSAQALLMEGDLTVAEVATAIGINQSTLYKWIPAARRNSAPLKPRATDRKSDQQTEQEE